MSELKVGGLALIVGPLSLFGYDEGTVHLEYGEVVEIEGLEAENGFEIAWVFGRASKIRQYIDTSSLTPLDRLYDNPDIDWGAIHDYVHEEDDLD
ncbi:hypothetical protein KIV66_gp52 [Mycobacterium phage MyraDee]|uniref:Uncharacterized protein n=1 Tax=Mycobacterium phage MyraDee TaxID=2024303 RepID=A0A222YZD7_9CAUD|nr:hypothetical protein KIV66_gp52 [Mycobacterium phage MyraDee]ASR77160.1 hypothetical protein SEA_MYRADEE_52 [Mycobacterium phage MyraDee]